MKDSLRPLIQIGKFGGTIEKFTSFNVSTFYNSNYLVFYRQIIVRLIDEMDEGIITWEEFKSKVRKYHANRLGGPYERKGGESARQEEYFYANPLPGCLCRRQHKKQ